MTARSALPEPDDLCSVDRSYLRRGRASDNHRRSPYATVRTPMRPPSCQAFVVHVFCLVDRNRLVLSRAVSGISRGTAHHAAIMRARPVGVVGPVLLAGACEVHAMATLY